MRSRVERKARQIRNIVRIDAVSQCIIRSAAETRNQNARERPESDVDNVIANAPSNLQAGTSFPSRSPMERIVNDYLPAAGVMLFFLSIPLWSKRAQKNHYTKSNALHGRLTLDVDDSGIHFGGPITSAQVAWAYFGKFFEDERAFVLYQKNQAIFHMVPKRALSADQVAGFRQYLQQNVRP